MLHSTASAPLQSGHRAIAVMDARPLQASGLHRSQPAMHLRRRCHLYPDLMDLHRWRLSWSLIEDFHASKTRLSRHILCRQASFRGVLCRVNRVPPICLRCFLYRTWPLDTNSGCRKREVHIINWSMVKLEKSAPVTGTILRTTGLVAVDFRQ